MEGRTISELITVGIVGVGSCIPEKILNNHDLEKMVDTSDDWIRTRTGIIERRIIDDGMFTSDLAAQAGLKALADAGLEPEEVDLIIVATASPDMIFPSTACLTQRKMGIRNCPAFDLLAACAGFSYGLSVATPYVATGGYKTVLLIGAEALSRFVNWSDRNTCVLFGDGAGAVVLQPVEKGYGVLSSHLAADGFGADLLKIPAGGAVMPGDENSVANRLHSIQMNGNEVFKFAVRVLPKAAKQALHKCGLTVADVDYLIPHQANQRIIDTAAQRLKISSQKVVSNISKYGNTSTASIPLALDELWQTGKLKKGDVLLFVGFGGGLTWGANVVKWSRSLSSHQSEST